MDSAHATISEFAEMTAATTFAHNEQVEGSIPPAARRSGLVHARSVITADKLTEHLNMKADVSQQVDHQARARDRRLLLNYISWYINGYGRP